MLPGLPAAASHQLTRRGKTDYELNECRETKLLTEQFVTSLFLLWSKFLAARSRLSQNYRVLAQIKP